MILSARLIQKPREIRDCGECGCLIDGKQLRLYGMAEYGDKPFTLYYHPYACTDMPSPMDNPKVKEKLRAASRLTGGQ